MWVRRPLKTAVILAVKVFWHAQRGDLSLLETDHVIIMFKYRVLKRKKVARSNTVDYEIHLGDLFVKAAFGAKMSLTYSTNCTKSGTNVKFRQIFRSSDYHHQSSPAEHILASCHSGYAYY